MAEIHQTAVVDTAAKIGADVSIGPYSVVGPDVTLGDNVVLKSHVVIDGVTEIGDGTQIYPFASIGFPPQDLKYGGEKSRLIVGRNNVIREHATMNTGTEGGGMETRVGDNGLFMIGSHVAHDCRVGNNVILANNASVAGHVQVGDFAILGGLAAVHQFVRIGEHSMIGGLTAVEHDVIPFGSVMGHRGKLSGLNIVGLKRRGFDRDTIHELRAAYRGLFEGDGTLEERLDKVVEQFAENEVVRQLAAFIRSDSKRGLVAAKTRNGG